MIATIAWTDVLVALVAGLPAIIAALFAGLTHRAVRTPSGERIGTQVEEAHHATSANTALLTAIVKSGPSPPSPPEPPPPPPPEPAG